MHARVQTPAPHPCVCMLLWLLHMAARATPFPALARPHGATSRSTLALFLAPAAHIPSDPTRMHAGAAACSSYYNMCNTGSTFTHLDIYLQHMSKTVETLGTYV
jgi:hypothetical protein